MSDRDHSITDERLEAYLDDLLDESARADFEAQLRSSPHSAEQVQLQARIDASLERLFAAEEPSPHDLEELATCVAQARNAPSNFGRGPRYGRSLQWMVGVAAAAVLAWGLASWLLPEHGHDEPFFAVTPVAAIYADTIASGFRPYYDCRDEERFRETFARRQGTPLRLSPLPKGTVMLGIAYPGGLSRDTTAMLCKVNDRPVMVFIDRRSNDLAEVSQNDDPDVHVFRTERDGLVFYEVTPFESSLVTPYLSVLRQ